MEIKDLCEKLSSFGNIEIIKKGTVFTLLMTGTKMKDFGTVNTISQIVTAAVSGEYPFIEAMKNGEGFFCLILKK